MLPEGLSDEQDAIQALEVAKHVLHRIDQTLSKQI
jgi:hypothetical protein